MTLIVSCSPIQQLRRSARVEDAWTHVWLEARLNNAWWFINFMRIVRAVLFKRVGATSANFCLIWIQKGSNRLTGTRLFGLIENRYPATPTQAWEVFIPAKQIKGVKTVAAPWLSGWLLTVKLVLSSSYDTTSCPSYRLFREALLPQVMKLTSGINLCSHFRQKHPYIH